MLSIYEVYMFYYNSYNRMVWNLRNNTKLNIMDITHVTREIDVGIVLWIEPKQLGHVQLFHLIVHSCGFWIFKFW